MDLLKFVDFHRFGNIWVENIFLRDVVAFLSDLLLSADYFVLDLKSAEAELAELFREVVWWDLYHSEKGRFFSFWNWREFQLSSDQVVVLAKNVLVEDDLVHSFSEINIYLVEKRGCVSRRFTSKGL